MSEPKKKVNVLANATKHYQNQIKEMNSFHVPEWDVTIHHRGVTTLAQESQVIELARQNKTVEAMVVTIINKARHEDGSLMFNKHDRTTLLNEVDPAVVLRVAEQINGGALPKMEELEKN
jgi:hypothetical protein